MGMCLCVYCNRLHLGCHFKRLAVFIFVKLMYSFCGFGGCTRERKKNSQIRNWRFPHMLTLQLRFTCSNKQTSNLMPKTHTIHTRSTWNYCILNWKFTRWRRFLVRFFVGFRKWSFMCCVQCAPLSCILCDIYQVRNFIRLEIWILGMDFFWSCIALV